VGGEERGRPADFGVCRDECISPILGEKEGKVLGGKKVYHEGQISSREQHLTVSYRRRGEEAIPNLSLRSGGDEQNVVYLVKKGVRVLKEERLVAAS